MKEVRLPCGCTKKVTAIGMASVVHTCQEAKRPGLDRILEKHWTQK